MHLMLNFQYYKIFQLQSEDMKIALSDNPNNLLATIDINNNR